LFTVVVQLAFNGTFNTDYTVPWVYEMYIVSQGKGGTNSNINKQNTKYI